MPRRDDFDDDFLDDPNSDAYDYKPVTSQPSGGGKALKLFMVVGVVAGLGAGAWVMLSGGSQSGDDVPLVRADHMPTKEKPDNPGGMNVPNRDKTVYDRVSGGNTEPKLERLLPRPEEPLDKPVATLDIPERPLEPGSSVSVAINVPEQTEASPVEVEEVPTPKAVEAPVADLPAEPSEDMAKEITAPAPPPPATPNAPMSLTKRDAKPSGPNQQDKDDLAQKIAEALQDVKDDDVETSAPAKKVASVTPPAKPQKPAQTGGYVLQLLSSKSESGVQQTWEKIKAKNSDILKSYGANIVKADLGPAKGIYYRLRVGPMAQSSDAKRLCDQLKSRNVGCFIVKLR